MAFKILIKIIDITVILIMIKNKKMIENEFINEYTRIFYRPKAKLENRRRHLLS